MSRILIIEDEVSIAELERDYLELSGFEVDTVNDGEQGLKKALEEEYDLFILDLMLPGMNGFDICRQVKTMIVRISAVISSVIDGVCYSIYCIFSARVCNRLSCCINPSCRHIDSFVDSIIKNYADIVWFIVR